MPIIRATVKEGCIERRSRVAPVWDDVKTSLVVVAWTRGRGGMEGITPKTRVFSGSLPLPMLKQAGNGEKGEAKKGKSKGRREVEMSDLIHYRFHFHSAPDTL